MATTYTTWTNAAGGLDWNVVGNWTNGIPDGNGAQFCAVFNGAVTQNGPMVNLDRTNYVFGVRTLRNFRGDIGSDGNPLKGRFLNSIDASQNVHIQGSGSVHLYQATYAVPKIFVDSPSATALTLTGDGINARVGILAITRGVVVVGSTANLDDGTIVVFGQGSKLTIHAKNVSEEHADFINVIGGGQLVSDRLTAATTQLLLVDHGFIEQTKLIHASGFVRQSGGQFTYTPSCKTASAFEYHGLRGILNLEGNEDVVMTGTLLRGPLLSVIAGGADVGGMTWTYDLTQKFP